MVKCLVVNTPMIMNVIWTAFKPLMDAGEHMSLHMMHAAVAHGT